MIVLVRALPVTTLTHTNINIDMVPSTLVAVTLTLLKLLYTENNNYNMYPHTLIK